MDVVARGIVLWRRPVGQAAGRLVGLSFIQGDLPNLGYIGESQCPGLLEVLAKSGVGCSARSPHQAPAQDRALKLVRVTVPVPNEDVLPVGCFDQG